MGRRIAFILASIHEGTSVHMWNSCLSSFRSDDDALIFLPGGRLGYSTSGEYLRNHIYSLVDSRNIDAIVAWSSSLTGQASAEEVSSFLSGYGNLPMVTIGLKVAGQVPCVDFDAYRGFYSLVVHMIRRHGKKRIVYIRGPENHESSQMRYSAYKAALADCGISYDPDLVSSPFPWGEGREAVREIVETRGLVPSLDFDCVVCASDLMMVSAVRYLEKLGVGIPQPVGVGGFNDSETNKLLSVSPTTVRMPIDGMAKTALENIVSMLDGKDRSGDIKLDAPLVIRRSCGCHDSFSGEDEAAKVIRDVPSFIRWAVAYSDQRLGRDDLEYVVAYAMKLQSPSRMEKETFISRFGHMCRIFFMHSGEADDLLEIFHWFATLLPLSDQTRDFCLKTLPGVILDVYSHVVGENEFHRLEQTGRTNAFKMELLGTRSMKSLAQAIRRHLPSLGFRQAYLVMDRGEKGRVLVGGYSSIDENLEMEDFCAPDLLPVRYDALTRRGFFVVEPLISGNEAVGYIFLEVEAGMEASLIEDVMACVSSTLKGIRLQEEAKEAQERAEGAERTISEFYANIAEGLREPLSSIRNALTLVPESGTRELVIDCVLKAEHLLDLVLIEKGEVEVHKTMCDTKAFFSALASLHGFSSAVIPDVLPAMYTDSALLDQSLEILYSLASQDGGTGGVNLSVAVTPNALSISIGVDNWHPVLIKNNPSLQLAEQTVMLLSGSFHFKDHSIMISVPWTSLSGPEAQGGFGTLLFIRSGNADLPSCLTSFSRVEVMDASQFSGSFSIPEGVTQLAYDASRDDGGGKVALNLLRVHQDTKSLPFLCFNPPAYGPDLWSSIFSGSPAGQRESSADILCCGDCPAGIERLDAFGHRVVFQTFSQMMEAVSATPSLIILDSCRKDQLETLRRSRLTNQTPVLIVKDHFAEGEIEDVMSLPNILVCNSCICLSDEFMSRLVGIFAGGQILPPLTGALVKKAIVYLNNKARSQISRWQIADSVNISEDYLTRIFKKEMGISPWDYLNRYRIQLASEMLKTSGRTINEIASEIGFQDQAYFCRVFKKIVGVAPGKLRK